MEPLQAFSGERHYADVAQEWLTFALKAQKQSADALKIRATMEYMSALSKSAPLPKITERTEGS